MVEFSENSLGEQLILEIRYQMIGKQLEMTGLSVETAVLEICHILMLLILKISIPLIILSVGIMIGLSMNRNHALCNVFI